MFEWLMGESSHSHSMDQMRAEFGQMLDAGRHVFDAATNALLGGTDLEVIRQDLFDTDKRINRAEQKIRREIVVHASVHGRTSFPACLVLMSIVKDAERVGDYAKNIFDLAELVPLPLGGEHKEDLIRLKDDISARLAACRKAFDNQDKPKAVELIQQLQGIEDHCDARVSHIISAAEAIPLGAAYALAYRYFKRVASHVFNILTSVVQPLHKIDFSTKPEEGTE